MELLEMSLGKLKKEKIWIELYKLRIVFLSDTVVAGTPLEDVGQAWPRMYTEILLITGALRVVRDAVISQYLVKRILLSVTLVVYIIVLMACISVYTYDFSLIILPPKF